MSDSDFMVGVFYEIKCLQNGEQSHRYYWALSINRKSYVIYRMISFPLTLNHP